MRTAPPTKTTIRGRPLFLLPRARPRSTPTCLFPTYVQSLPLSLLGPASALLRSSLPPPRLRLHAPRQRMADVARPPPSQKLPPTSSPYHGLPHGGGSGTSTNRHAMSTRSGDGAGLQRRAGLPEPPLQLPRPSSSGAGAGNLKRKRAGSVGADEAGRPRSADLVVRVPAAFPIAHPNLGSTEHICLCTPAPKVPRPRNGASLSFPAALPRARAFQEGPVRRPPAAALPLPLLRRTGHSDAPSLSSDRERNGGTGEKNTPSARQRQPARSGSIG